MHITKEKRDMTDLTFIIHERKTSKNISNTPLSVTQLEKEYFTLRISVCFHLQDLTCSCINKTKNKAHKTDSWTDDG